MKERIKFWIELMRLNSLVLSGAGIILGCLLAAADGHFNIGVLILGITTASMLQILTNLANDLGDFERGTDNEERLGSVRPLQSGKITLAEMKKAIGIAIFFSLIFGLALVFFTFKGHFSWDYILFILLGLGAVGAAMKYTLGKFTFAYSGLGDVVVFIFFGLVSVIGAYYLSALQFYGKLFLPASALGLLCVGVLHLNNMRDAKNDKACGKRTIAIRLGKSGSKIYFAVLILVAILFSSAFLMLQDRGGTIAWLTPSYALLLWQLRNVLQIKEDKNYDVHLKFLSMNALFFVLSLGGAVLWS